MKVRDREKILVELHEEHPILEQIQFTEFDLPEKIQKKDYLYIKYKELYQKEKAHLVHMLDLKNTLVGRLYDKLRFHDDRKLSKQEIEKYYLNSDKKIVALNALIEKQEVRVEFFELAAESMNQQGWSIKNYLESQRL